MLLLFQFPFPMITSDILQGEEHHRPGSLLPHVFLPGPLDIQPAKKFPVFLPILHIEEIPDH